MEKLDLNSPNITNENVRKIAELFPNCVTESDNEETQVVNFDALKQELSDNIVEGNKERYQLSWPGKSESIINANSSINKSLRPIRENSKRFDNTENLYIEGDNLEVLKLLQETYLGKIKMIYIDPPYNTGRNLIYKNDFSINHEEFLQVSGQLNEDKGILVTNKETNGRFHSDWLSMIYSRLKLAKRLLTKDGVMVCAIDENEQASLTMILKELFSESSYEHVCVSLIHNPRGIQGKNFSYNHEYAIFIIPKNFPKIISEQQLKPSEVDWSQFRNWGSESERMDAKNCFYPVIIKNGEIIGAGDVCSDDYHPRQTEQSGDEFYIYPIDNQGIERKWRYAQQSFSSVQSMLRARKTENGYQIEIGKTSKQHKTVWSDPRYDANEYGTKIVNQLVEGGGFTFPKSLWTVYDAVSAVTRDSKDALVLDFFSGSGTTAHALMQLNAEDGGKRKFIMAQIPESVDEKSEIFKAGYENICMIARERINRAGEKIIKDYSNAEGISDLDIGFRTLKVSSSNMKNVYFSADDTNQKDLMELSSNIKEDRTDEDLFFMVLLNWGIPLSVKIESRDIAGKKVYFADGDFFAASFENNLDENFVKALIDEKPRKVVFKDCSFVNDSVKVNIEQILKQAHIEAKVI